MKYNLAASELGKSTGDRTPILTYVHLSFVTNQYLGKAPVLEVEPVCVSGNLVLPGVEEVIPLLFDGLKVSPCFVFQLKGIGHAITRMALKRWSFTPVFSLMSSHQISTENWTVPHHAVQGDKGKERLAATRTYVFPNSGE